METGHDHAQLTSLAIVVLAALACGITMQRLRQPAVAGYIFAGILLGPSGLGLVENRANVQMLAELGVLMLLFVIGMELSLRGIRAVWKVALATTLVQIAVSLLAMFGLGKLLDWPTAQVVVVGFVFALSSTAVAIKMLEDLGELRSRVGQLTVGVLIGQDLAVVPMMLIVSSMGGEGGSVWDAVIKVAVSMIFLALLIVYLSRRERLRLPFASLVGRSIDLTPLAGLACCFGGAAISGLLGLSAAYGAFLAGLIIGNSTGRRIMIHYTTPIQSVLLMMFFLSIGLLINFDFIWDHIWTVTAIVIFVTIFKTALNVGLLRLLGETWPRSFLSGVLLAQVGEFSFVLGALAISLGSIAPEMYGIIVAVTVISLIISPLWLATAKRLHRVLLLGITSGRETLRLTFSPQFGGFTRSERQAAAQGAARGSPVALWLESLTPRRRPRDEDDEP